MSYREAPASRFFIEPNNVGFVDLAEIVEVWQLTNDEWRILYKNSHISTHGPKTGLRIFEALCAYRRETA